MSRYSLFESSRATFDAAGVARVFIGPQRAFERWHITLITITTTSVLGTSFKLYRGQLESPSALVDISNYNGNNDVSDSVIDLTPAERMLGIWAGGTPGAIGTMTVSGDSIR